MTLSRVISKIKEIIFDLASEAPSNDELFLDEDTVFELDTTDMQYIDDNEVISNIIKKIIFIKDPLDMTDIEKQQIIQNLHDELGKIKEITLESNNLPLFNLKTSICSHKEYLQQCQMKRKKEVPNVQILDKISNYLLLPLALETENPLKCQLLLQIKSEFTQFRLYSDLTGYIK
ncbi:16005_t:CDS:2 [Cetraspora pellucida]|uniref:16005_t:CDS:1 n=1 Tax=Cetraspora pellucida TaxID=1433469 RepID=A0A9N9AM15_9GLOM|nr:16005_t:CDS:2 [Cetraspora pellucida]